MKVYKKKNFPVEKVRRFLEPGPIALVSSQFKGETDIMAMGWHTVLEFSPSLVGCMITQANHSFELIRKSKECVINIPTVELLNIAVRIGNCSGKDVNKFSEFNLTPEKADAVDAPLIRECFANLECKLVETKLFNSYNFFIFEVVKAHAPTTPKYPKTFHYTGDGVFMTSGKHVSRKSLFKPEYL
ncbi:flavin reductase family protein [Bdellovibrio sp. SKB1291214]|uniref:flavin reductase family protein n=1 Tax=Bdellovibrio sp. SKB1291214 TaxID=1732569 RepID=UPI000B5182F8|nr:flavin reductase family protein [Bdellovibrio sp. SKB1291214]UYL09935.1 flavin reductase family protein [Bdellovibrio sp. SKB1291214]